MSLKEYFLSCFPFSKDVKQNNSFLDLIDKDEFRNKEICIICKRKDQMLRRLFCGHMIDDICLKHLFDNKMLACPLD